MIKNEISIEDVSFKLTPEEHEAWGAWIEELLLNLNDNPTPKMPAGFASQMIDALKDIPHKYRVPITDEEFEALLKE